MSTVFFKTTQTQDKEIETLMAEEGYSSKAEFFRFLLKFFKYTRQKEPLHLNQAVDSLRKTIQQLNKKGLLKNLPSAEMQLSDL